MCINYYGCGKHFIVGCCSEAVKVRSFKLCVTSMQLIAFIQFGDLDQISRPQGCRKGKSTSCIFSANSYLIKFKFCVVVVYMDNIMHEMVFRDSHFLRCSLSQSFSTLHDNNLCQSLHVQTSFGDRNRFSRSQGSLILYRFERESTDSSI